MENLNILINEEKLKSRIFELSKQIEKDYINKEIVFICILKGSLFFTAELTKNISNTAIFDFVKVSSYNGGTESCGIIKLDVDLMEDIENKHVIVVEDIIDTGRTLSYLMEYLSSKKPASIKLATLLDKPSRRVIDISVDYIGFQIPDEFVVGFGLDYDEKLRNLPYIGYFKK